MARVRKVTRTIISTDVEVMTVNTATQEIKSVVVTVAGTYNRDDEKDEKALDKAVRKSFVNLGLDSTVVMVSITDTTPVTKHYEMLEDDFIKLAKVSIVGDGSESEDEDSDEDNDEDNDEE